MFVKTAIRNIFRHKRRTVLNVLAIAVNVTGIIFLCAFYRGGVLDKYKRTIDYLTAHIQIHHSNYEENKRGLPLDLFVNDSEKIKEFIYKDDSVAGVSERIDFNVTMNNGTKQVSCLGIGIQPKEEENIGVLKDVIIKGDYLTPWDEGILIGHKLASVMNLDIGDTVIAFFSTAHNQPNLFYTEVKGIFNYKFSVLDKSAIFFSYNTIREYLNMPEGPTKIMIRMKDKRDVPRMMEYLSVYNNKYAINTWHYFAKALIEDTRNDISFMVILFLILTIIAIFGIVNTMTTSVIERTKEIGTIRAIGMSKSRALRLFLLESLCICIIGIVMGWIFGFGLSLYFAKVGIPFGETLGETVKIPVGERVYAAISIWEYLGTLLLGFISGIMGGIIPAVRACNLRVVDALRE